MAIADDLTFLRGLTSTVAERLIRYRDDARQVEADYMLSQAGRRERVDALTQRLLRDLDSLEQRAKDAKARIEGEVQRRFQRDDSDPVRALLRESREERAWMRSTRILDATPEAALPAKVEGIIQRAAEQGDSATLWGLDSELPAYLEARGQAGLVGQALAALRRALLPHLSEPQREALAWADELSQGWQNVVAALRQARLEAAGQSRTVGLPGWRGESVSLVA